LSRSRLIAPASAGTFPGSDHEAAAVEDLRDSSRPRWRRRARESHRVEELSRHLPRRVRGLSLGHGDDVGGDQVARHILERNLAGHS